MDRTGSLQPDRNLQGPSSDGSNTWTLIACSIIILVMVIATINRNAVWGGGELSLWKDVVSKSPNKPGGHANLAMFYESIGNYKAAFDEYLLAMKLGAERYNQTGQLRDLDTLVLSQSNLGLMMMELGDNRAAEAAFKGSLSLMPGHGGATINLSNLMIREGRFAEVITVIDEALILKNFGSGFTSIGKLYNNKAIAMAYLGYCDLADKFFIKAAQVDPDIPPGARCEDSNGSVP